MAGKTSIENGVLETNFVVEKTKGDVKYYVMGIKYESENPNHIYTLEVKEKKGVLEKAEVIVYEGNSLKEFKNINRFNGKVSSFNLKGNINNRMEYRNGIGDCPPNNGDTEGNGDNNGGTDNDGGSGTGDGYPIGDPGGGWPIDGGIGSDDNGGSNSGGECGNFRYSHHIYIQHSFAGVTKYIAVGDVYVNDCEETMAVYYDGASSSNNTDRGLYNKTQDHDITPSCDDGSGVIIDVNWLKNIISNIKSSLQTYNSPLTDTEKTFLFQHYNLTTRLGDYPINSEQSAAFMHFAIQFATQNPNVTCDQFQNWFINSTNPLKYYISDYSGDNSINDDDDYSPLQNLQNFVYIPEELEMANGEEVKIEFGITNSDKKSAYQKVNPKLVESIKSALEVASKTVTIKSIFIKASTNGAHASTSNHYKGIAIDISKINGIQINGNNDTVTALQNAFESLDYIRENFGPYFKNKNKKPWNVDGHQDHIHISINL